MAKRSDPVATSERAVTFQDRQNHLIAWLNSRSSSQLIALIIALFVVIGVMDYSTYTEMNWVLVYWIPVAVTTWFFGPQAGWTTGLMVSVFETAHETWQGRRFAHPSVMWWDLAMRVLFFTIVVPLLAQLRRALLEEQDLRKSQEELTRLKSTMVSVASHEFQNALAAIRLAVHDLRESDQNGAPERGQMYTLLENVVTTLNVSTTNLLADARSDAGRLDLHPTRIDLREIINDTAKYFALIMQGKGLQLQIQTCTELSTIVADQGALTLILNNLVGNAIKYTPQGGVITVETRRARHGGVCILVRDTGIGISPEDISHLTGDFYRTESAQALVQGHGLGLKIARDMIERHGGRLEVASEVGKGSSFMVILPSPTALPLPTPHPFAHPPHEPAIR